MPFEVRFQATLDAASHAIHQCADADTATVALHAALEELQHSDRDGDLFVVKHDPGRRRVLHYPLRRPGGNA
jgi:hypothetical protein